MSNPIKKMRLVVYVPETHADLVREAMGKAGAGVIGNYSHCSFSTQGVGRYRPEDGAHPATGEVGKMEEIVEERIETVCEFDKVKQVVDAIEKVHLFEEAPIDVYPLELW